MPIIKIFLTVAVNENVGTLLFFCFTVKNRFYDDKKSRNIIITENNDWEMTISKNNDLKVVIIGWPLFFWNNTPEITGSYVKFNIGVITSRWWSIITPSLGTSQLLVCGSLDSWFQFLFTKTKFLWTRPDCSLVSISVLCLSLFILFF